MSVAHRLLPAALALLAGLAPLWLAGAARAESLLISLSSHQVAITSNYAGSQVVLFGAIQRDAQTIARAGPYQAAVIVRGPPQSVTVRLREELGFVWINGEQQKFASVPAFYAALTSAPLDEIAAPILRERLAVGLDGFALHVGDTMPRDGREALFREALVRIKRDMNLYVERERGIAFMTPEIFRAAITLPADAPPGNYEVEAMLFADGALLARETTNFELVKIGFEQRIAFLAEEQSLVYGLGTAGAALFLGEPDAASRAVWEANVAAHELGLSLIRPGATCSGICAELNRFLAERGLLQHRSFGYGHSFGILSHYYGREAGLELREDIDTVLEPGMVVSMEPMLRIPEGAPGAGGYREHDILVLTADGADNITRFPYGPDHNVI